ncbi:metalloregulator ArsR/SmtB family transcription factor [Streptomyces sp. NPDC004610]|uniref:ArsR/SmtB family transcription factor n=1 Tax=unclassified Streptomyces TaxID=2593676 RepID=UPI0033BB024C
MPLSVDTRLVRAVANPIRLRIVTLLAAEPLDAARLMAETGASPTNLSNHLKLLREAGLVEPEARARGRARGPGRSTRYRLRPETIGTLAGQFQRLAESARGQATAHEIGYHKPSA